VEFARSRPRNRTEWRALNRTGQAKNFLCGIEGAGQEHRPRNGGESVVTGERKTVPSFQLRRMFMREEAVVALTRRVLKGADGERQLRNRHSISPRIERRACRRFDRQTSVFTPTRSRKLGAVFRSPVTTLSPPLRGHRSRPAPSPSHRIPFQARWIRNSFAPSGFEAVPGRNLRSEPVSCSVLRRLSDSLRPPLPFRFLQTFRIKAFSRRPH